MNLPDTHLDLGCGMRPRNPYERQQLFGVDIRDIPRTTHFESRQGNLALDPIPYTNDMFGSVSAFDFIEHIPRVLAVSSGRETIFPFIRLMNEVWRVLAPGGRFYAVTPAFPQPEAFVDPTHVNIITDRTHLYFCGDSPYGRMYGFEGQFKLVRVEWTPHDDLAFLPEGKARDEALRIKQARDRQPHRWLASRVRESLRFLRGKRKWTLDIDRKSHLLWEFEAVKPALIATQR